MTIHRGRRTGALAPVMRYFALAVLLSWAAWISIALAGGTVERGEMLPTNIPGLLGPMLAAFVVTWRSSDRAGINALLQRMARWRVGWRWWATAFSPIAYFVIAAPASRFVDGSWPEWSAFDRMNGYPEIGVLAVWALVVLLNGFGEETGWRGFAIDHLQRGMTPLAATLVVAVIWAIWHAPLFFFVESFSDFSPGTLVGFFFGMACGAVVLTWLYNRSGRSILIVATWHGTYNIVSGTAGADGTVAAIVSSLIMLQAIVLVALELRAMRHSDGSVLGPKKAVASIRA